MAGLGNFDVAVIFIFFVLYFLFPYDVFSQVSISKSSNSHTDNYDEVETSDGFKCRSGLTSATQFEIGIAQQDEQIYLDQAFGADNENKAVAYGKITYSFGMPKRPDCTRLYDLQIQILEEKLKALQQQ